MLIHVDTLGLKGYRVSKNNVWHPEYTKINNNGFILVSTIMGQ